jgi:hypothetical protein
MTFGPEAFTFLYHKFVGFVTAGIIMSVLQGVACYVASFRSGALLALGGNTGHHIYDVRAHILGFKLFHYLVVRLVLYWSRTQPLNWILRYQVV